MTLFYFVAGFVIVQRIAELFRAKRNEKLAFAAGGVPKLARRAPRSTTCRPGLERYVSEPSLAARAPLQLSQAAPKPAPRIAAGTAS